MYLKLMFQNCHIILYRHILVFVNNTYNVYRPYILYKLHKKFLMYCMFWLNTLVPDNFRIFAFIAYYYGIYFFARVCTMNKHDYSQLRKTKQIL